MRAKKRIKTEFLLHLRNELDAKNKHNRKSIEHVAASYGITDKSEVKEYTELAIVLKARSIALSPLPLGSKYASIVDLYKSQVNISHRTSQSILLQQYSTPAPISFLAGIFVNAETNISVFEPSAGNGLLTIAAQPSRVIVNEIDELRRSNLQDQGYRQVLSQDATVAFKDFEKKFDAIITNPPFGLLNHEVKYDTFGIEVLDHLMALRALDCMKDNGKAAIIIGGHTRYDKKGRIQKGKNRFFFNYLFSRYNVLDIIPIDGKKLYSRQGTSFDTRLILIDGRKSKPSGAAPLKDEVRDKVVDSFEELFERVMSVTRLRQDFGGQANPRKEISMNKFELEAMATEAFAKEAQALALELELMSFDELGMPYTPASSSCFVLNTVVPDSMGYETHAALQRIKEAVGGDIDEYVRIKLNYRSKVELCKALSAEQIDAVAMSVYNIEERGVGMIIGDQTGIGKGRIAASVIRYAVEQGVQPIFITEKSNLFSDIYRDLVAIGSAHLIPFIVNGRESKTDIKDEDGNIIYQALSAADQTRIFESHRVPKNFHFVVATYSQFNSPEKKPTKPAFLNAIAEDNIVIMDEAHNSSGSGNTGNFMQSALSRTRGVVFLSATFAKRPDNMPIYAMKTSIRDASMTREALIEAITKGGVALQEILASQLVAEGQMIRRERSFEGVEVNYITLDEKEQEHKAIADNITSIIRDIIKFQTTYVDEIVEELDDIAVAEGKQVEVREGTSQAGVDNLPYFSKVFNVINQMLFSIKAEAVAERAIARLKEGKKPVIAFASTMGSFIEQMETDAGMAVTDGDTINADFSVVLQKGLDGILRYTETDTDGQKIFKKFEISEFPIEAQYEYNRISDRIREAATGITISPIDVIVKKIKDAGYKVAEVTGRKYELQVNTKMNKALVMTRKRVNTNDAFRQFNNNEVDVLLINQSGSTGASAHAIITPKVPKEQVKQRVMIVLQAELDINTEVQKRGRINRTGQIYKPIYDYVNSAIPAEKRLMMMLQKKLKSLDANTTSNQKSSTKILDVPDFLNKYGDRIVAEYLKENPEVNMLLDDPLGLATREVDGAELEDAAHRVSGRVAVLSTAMQLDFYNEISNRYNEYVEYLKQIGDYDLEVEAMDLQAETQTSRTVIVGKGGTSEFGDDSILESVMANVLKKPFTRQELNNLLTESLQGKDGRELQKEIKLEYEGYIEEQLRKELADNVVYYEELMQNVPQEKKIQKLVEKGNAAEAQEAIKARTNELHKAMADAEEKLKRLFNNRKQYLESIFDSFYVGRNLNYPVSSYDGGQELVPAVFLGFIIDKKKKNPYAPSGLRLRFALASSNKYIAIPASYSQDVRAIIGASVGLPYLEKESLLAKWEASIKESTVDRKIRHVITGNVLQAFSAYKGKLVSYTTIDGGIKKGILMPEYWEPGNDVQQKTVVPIFRAMKIIRSLTTGASITTKNGVSLFKQPGKFKIVVSAARSKGGDTFLDPDLLTLVDNNNFEKVSDRMTATVSEDRIVDFVQIFQEKFNDSVSLSPSQYELIKGEIPKKEPRSRPVVVMLPKQSSSEVEQLELEAMALELELELLNFAA
ncbi:MAG TPA: strawberry notch family protein [Cyclobacteriaceae bacterium]|nr:strawberry notch family protein [Cyclobacteriaceae bacterium]HMX00911.1 strawberry notch family protein [Cyclobacteriaceae bacterium]HMY93715.1 strawberry notch family protein [Cyclobacteriaceae bacterium]HNE94710.1 strawberry notch family protein [Cyclobacteriaceae bacterium]HNI15042.1 strawberry notch family protein [Cyclobacteriaceae bacterium]